MSAWLLMQAWTDFLYLDAVALLGFNALQRVVTQTPTRRVQPRPATVAGVVAATETAAVFYIKGARCLHRAAVATRLLRRRGVAAHLVIGCQLVPMKGHAWVEVAGDVVMEQVDDLAYFHVVDRW